MTQMGTDQRREFTPAEKTIEEILGRYTVTDLIEQTDADLVRGDELFYKSKTPIKIIDQGERHMIRWWRVESGDKFYEIRRFRNFVWCSCKGFFFSKRMCKHLALTVGVYCQHCRVLSARVGKLCYDCDMQINHFLK